MITKTFHGNLRKNCLPIVLTVNYLMSHYFINIHSDIEAIMSKAMVKVGKLVQSKMFTDVYISIL